MPTMSPSPSARSGALALVACLAAACSSPAGGGTGVTASTPPPAPPTPALTQAEAKAVVAAYMRGADQVRARLDPVMAASVFTGSSLGMETTKYRIFKANRIRIGKVRYTQALGASPKFSGHPRWFFAALTDTGTRPVTRDIILFEQQAPGGPWRAAYTTLATKPVRGPLGPGIDVADEPDVVPLQDATLALPPAQVPAALVQVLNQGVRSPRARVFAVPSWVASASAGMRRDRADFRRSGWNLAAAYRPSTLPVYAVRTTSGGALVWSAVESHRAYRNTGRGGAFDWRHPNWGDMLRPTIGRSSVRRGLTTVERYEVLAYVPPKGKGRIRLLANRWAPVRIQGR
ncbi:hypothetical protein [Spirillospora albida]|uniref:hypothetical protein n=1 Tax=Spirillospora albida TaxID=58123 RepID=UPI0004C1BBA1|nr:hypothetical protein [Spirillospora albida]